MVVEVRGFVVLRLVFGLNGYLRLTDLQIVMGFGFGSGVSVNV